MKKITDFIINKRIIILIVFIILSGICLYSSTKVNINSDITKYLPDSSETKKGNEIMTSEFDEQKSSYLNVMFKNLSQKEKEKTLNKLEKIKGVSSVTYDSSKDYNKDNYTLYILNVDDYAKSKTSEKVYKSVKENFNVSAMSGPISDKYKPVLQLWIVALAIGISMIILTILSESYIEPWLYLFSIGIAVFINKGTNIIFPSVSNITDSIVAILQLALSMDYSIMLSNRYKQERKKQADKIKAMKEALYESFKEISSSSITTVVGLLALVFMSFTIGKDLGFVLAKGVLLSLISIFLCLPSLLLMFDKQIMNSKKKSVKFNLEKLGNFSYKTRYVQLFIIVIAFILAYFLKGNLQINYTGSETDEVGKIFPATNQIAIVYENKYEEIMSELCKEISNDKKANQVLCYGNTLNEKLAYNELNNKFKELGQDTQIDDYLIKIIYYNYYNKNNKDSMTLNDFIKFIKNDVYTNKKISSSVNKDTKDNIKLLENFTTKENINKKRTTSELASLLNMNENDLKDILVLYNSKSTNTKISIKDFINFVLNDLAKDKRYSSSLDENTINNLKRLEPFTKTTLINQKMSSEEIANIFNIDNETASKLYLFYRTTIETSSNLTINEFSNIALELKNNTEYQNLFTSELINKLLLLETLSNNSKINEQLSSNNLSKTLNNIGINELDTKTINMIFFYNYYLNNISNGEYTTNTKLSLNQFVNNVILDNNINDLLPASINSYRSVLAKFSDSSFINKKMNSTDISKELTFFGFNENDIKMIYANLYKEKINNEATDEEALNNTIIELTPYELINIIKTITPEDNSNYKTINLLINIMDLSYNQTYKIIPTYDYQTLSSYLSNISNDININNISLGYAYYDYKINSDDSYKTMSIKSLINFIITNKDNTLISNKINNKELLELAYIIVNNTDTKYSYQELSKLLNQDEELVKKIYSIADYTGLSTMLTPYEFTNLILDNASNKLINSKIDENTLETLKLLKLVMDSSNNNTKYNSKELSKILNSEENKIDLILSLYSSKKNKDLNKISLINLTNFMISDILPNNNYNSKINKESKDKLITINGIMKNTLSNKKYNSFELYNVLSKLNNKLDYNLVDMVYIYHGSKNSYDKSWKLTIEEIISYLNDNMLKDEKYSNFIDKEMKDKILNAQEKINDSKKLLVSRNYSRIVINSKYGFEDNDTFNFINNIKDKIGNKEGIYIAGNSPMAIEMDSSFNSELTFITILTMIFIFIVVAITFKDLLIPLILVMIIECAVFITMAILSLTGTHVYFIALLIVQAILMGATIDYAIVYTSYYKEFRQTMGIKESIINAYNNSVHTILCSSSILIIVTLVVGNFASAIAAMICKTISEGTICSVILIVFILPGILAICDKLICRKENKK